MEQSSHPKTRWSMTNGRKWTRRSRLFLPLHQINTWAADLRNQIHRVFRNIQFWRSHISTYKLNILTMPIYAFILQKWNLTKKNKETNTEKPKGLVPFVITFLIASSMKSTARTCAAFWANSAVKRPTPAPSSATVFPSYGGSSESTCRMQRERNWIYFRSKFCCYCLFKLEWVSYFSHFFRVSFRGIRIGGQICRMLNPILLLSLTFFPWITPIKIISVIFPIKLMEVESEVAERRIRRFKGILFSYWLTISNSGFSEGRHCWKMELT